MPTWRRTQEAVTPRKLFPSPEARTPKSPSPAVSPHRDDNSPAHVVVNGHTLATLCDFVIDWCSLRIMIQGVKKGDVERTRETLRSLLRLEGIRFRAAPQNEPEHRRVFYIRDADGMQRLMCKLPGRLTNVVRERA